MAQFATSEPRKDDNEQNRRRRRPSRLCAQPAAYLSAPVDFLHTRTGVGLRGRWLVEQRFRQRRV